MSEGTRGLGGRVREEKEGGRERLDGCVGEEGREGGREGERE